MIKTARSAGSAIALFLFLSSCSARYDISLGKGGKADISFHIALDKTVLDGMAQKAAMFAGEEQPAETLGLDAAAIKAKIGARKDMKLNSLENLSPTVIRGSLSVPDLAALGKTENGAAPFFAYAESEGSATLTFKLDRKNAASLPALLVGMDAAFLEILAPPALYGDDLSEEEYRQTLLAFVGKRDMPAFEASKAELRIKPPGKITASSGGKVENDVLIVTIPALSAMVLEKPVAFSLSWKISP